MASCARSSSVRCRRTVAPVQSSGRKESSRLSTLNAGQYFGDTISTHNERASASDIAYVDSVTGAASVAQRGLCEDRSEEPTSEIQSLMRISYAVFCLQKTTIYYILTSIIIAS